jgi:hypothetical protein
MPCVDAVTVVCDRCGRPGWQLEISPINGAVIVSGARLPGDDTMALACVAGPRPDGYRLNGETPPGMFILAATGPPTNLAAPYGERDKLVCIGRKHKRYARVVTRESAERSYHGAVAAGRSSIGLREIA